MESIANVYVKPTTSAEARMVRSAQTLLALGAAAAVVFAGILLIAPLTPDGHHFQHAGDYWITALGIPYMFVPLLLLPKLRTLQHGRDGKLGRAGQIVMSAGLIAYLPLFAYGLATGAAESLGPTYMLATLATFVGLTCFAAGSFRARLLPRWLLILWPIAWFVGGPLALNALPLLLAAVYMTIAIILPRRTATPIANT